jgi:hypothetical protein
MLKHLEFDYPALDKALESPGCRIVQPFIPYTDLLLLYVEALQIGAGDV